MLLRSQRLNITDAEQSDIPAIIAMESDPYNHLFVWIGTVEQHRAEIADPDHLLLKFSARESGALVGYALIFIDRASNKFELRRIVIAEKAQGYGREALLALIRYAFDALPTNRFWLDVYPDNDVGIHLYESIGLHRDGVLRENYKSERGYLDQIVYSMLRSEYEAGALK